MPRTAGSQAPSMLKDSLYNLDPGPDSPRIVRMIVETPRGSSNKCEYDSQTRIFRLDRPLYSPMHYPAEYGFIPGTIAEDGDPLDVLCLIEYPTFTGCLIEVRPIGMLDLIDQTTTDQKLIATPVNDPRYARVQTIEDLPQHVMREIEYFFTIYKELEEKVVETRGRRNQEHAFDRISASRRRYQDVFSLVEDKGKR